MNGLHIGSRLSFKGDLCTVRFIGKVSGKKGLWIGVEWDDQTRGKHSGTFAGNAYFSCRSTGPRCASFLPSDARFAEHRTVEEAVEAKYASYDGSAQMAVVQLSGKTIEETGYDKIALQQSNLESLTNIILDCQRISTPGNKSRRLDEVCPQATLVDLGYNLFESFDDVCKVLGHPASLKTLSLEGNRLSHFNTNTTYTNVTTLNLDHMLLDPQETGAILTAFPALKRLSISDNYFSRPGVCHFPPGLEELELNENGFSDLASVAARVAECHQLAKLGLKQNRIASIHDLADSTNTIDRFPQCVKELDLSYNEIATWTFFDSISACVSGLKHLRISGNPIYASSEIVKGKVTTPAQVSMLVIARIPQLETLNFTTIADKDRLNAETSYLSLITDELANSPLAEQDTILSHHPRFEELCEEYGRPDVTRKEDQAVDPNSIAAHLISCRVYFADPLVNLNLPGKADPKLIEFPQSFSMYTVYSAIARRFGMLTTSLRLIWETGERDPPDRGMPTHAATVEEWDSDDEEEGPSATSWVDREVELVVGTRPMGTVVEKRDAVIRIEFKGDIEDVLLSTFLAQEAAMSEARSKE